MAENLSSHHSSDDESVISDMQLDKTNTRATEHVYEFAQMSNLGNVSLMLHTLTTFI